MTRVHIVGAGLSGLSCAVHLAKSGHRVTLYEAAGQAGGRCRSYFDAQLGVTIDNGNHLLFSANRAALEYLRLIDASDSLVGPARARFPFFDLRSGAHWIVEPGAGRIPWWIFSKARRIPRSGIGDYLAGLRLAFAGPDARVGDCLNAAGPLWERFWEPLTVAALNTAPHEASARLLWRTLRDSFGRGEAACRPLIAREGLASSLIDPALGYLKARGAEIHFNRRLRGLDFAADRAARLDFGGPDVDLEPGDMLVVALPPAGAMAALPGLEGPQDTRPIVNAHIKLPRRPLDAALKARLGLDETLPILGLTGGTAQWLFIRGAMVSLTISAAEAEVDMDNEALTRILWAETAKALALPPEPVPPIRIIKERRATFAQTPAALRLRPPAGTRWSNVVLAGDWTDTGYPATIEGAIRSGRTAAALVTEKSRRTAVL
jgi:squalene-associated FAD-dependent desaturase